MLIQFVDAIGEKALAYCESLGKFSLFIGQSIKVMFSKKLKIAKLLKQMERIGINSLLITSITGFFAGAVLTLQSYKGFHMFGGEDLIGPVVALTMTRELGPVLTGLMVAGRSGSAIAAEIGTMKITEQIDALKTLCISPHQYLIIPRVIAGTIVLPLLALFSMGSGIFGGYMVFVHILGLNSEEFLTGIREFVEIKDVFGGMIKASVFGFLLTSIGSYKGFFTRGGARGVGIATTQSVVVSSIFIIISNYFLAVIIFGTQ